MALFQCSTSKLNNNLLVNLLIYRMSCMLHLESQIALFEFTQTNTGLILKAALSEYQSLGAVTDSSLKNKKHFCPESLCLPSNTWKPLISRVCSINNHSEHHLLPWHVPSISSNSSADYKPIIIKSTGANHLCQPLWKIPDSNSWQLIFVEQTMQLNIWRSDCPPHF